MTKKVMMTEEQAKSLAAGADDTSTRRLRDRIHNLASRGKTYSTPADTTPWRTVDMAASVAGGAGGGSRRPGKRSVPSLGNYDEKLRAMASQGVTPEVAAVKLGISIEAVRGAYRRLGLGKGK